jgi:hypothetical protein
MNRRVAIAVGTAAVAITLMSAAVFADTTEDEIDYLISSVDKSGCAFIRNGKRYSGSDARAHLKSKRRANARLIDSAEDFIEKIASKSSMSGKPYLISCKGQERQTAGEWFTELLMKYRGEKAADESPPGRS